MKYPTHEGLNQILLNSVSNSILDEGNISVTLNAEERYFTVSLADERRLVPQFVYGHKTAPYGLTKFIESVSKAYPFYFRYTDSGRFDYR